MSDRRVLYPSGRDVEAAGPDMTAMIALLEAAFSEVQRSPSLKTCVHYDWPFKRPAAPRQMILRSYSR